ncbi:stress response protein nst1 isoform X2 [Ixodes scapularis]
MLERREFVVEEVNGSSKTGDDSDDRSSDSKEMDDSRAASKSRRSPLRIIGDFLDSHRGRFGSTHRKAKSGEPLSLSHEPSEHRRRKGGAQPPGCEEPVGTSPPAGPEEGDDHSWPEQPPEPEPPPKDVQIDIPPVCFAAETEHDQQSWTEALRTRAQACSLDIQGLNLEGCANLAAGIREVSKRDENVLAQTLELLDELLKKKTQGQKLKKGQDQLGNSQEGVDEVEQASIMAHQEALRKATHLRQRKISTELKVETLQKQLRKPSKKSQPKAIPELPEGREIVEEQLVELTEKLRRLEGNLGQTEREALKVRREWDKRMEEVYQHLFDDKQLLPEAFREPWTQDGTPRILVSKTQDSGRSGGSLRVRAAKFIPSPKAKKKDNEGHNGSMKKSASNHSLNGSSKTGDDSDDRSSDSKEMDDSRAAAKSRRSPLRIIGDFLDSHRGRFGSTHRKAKSGEPLSLSHEPSEHRRRKGGAQPPGCEEPVGTSPPAGPEEGDDHSWPEQPPEPEPPPKDVQILQAPEEVPPASLDSGGDSYGSEDAHSLDSGGALVVDPVEAPLRYEVDPDILAEIEAFEQMAQDYLKRHGQDFPF